MKTEKAKNIIDTVSITNHAICRFNERSKYKNADEKFLRTYLFSVLARGIHNKSIITTSCREKNETAVTERKNRKAVVFDNNAYIFAADYSALVTVLNIKRESVPRYRALSREKIAIFPMDWEIPPENEFFGQEAV